MTVHFLLPEITVGIGGSSGSRENLFVLNPKISKIIRELV